MRDGAVQIKDAYAALREGEVWVHNMHMAPYPAASRENHEPERPRKLLLHRREIERLIGKTAEKGLTLVPDPPLLQGPATRRSRSPWRAARRCTTSAAT